MEFSINVDTLKSEWSIVYIEGIQVIISKNIKFLSLNMDFILANRADPDEMPLHAPFHLGLGMWWLSGRVLDSRLRARASPETLCCALQQDTLSSA